MKHAETFLIGFAGLVLIASIGIANREHKSASGQPATVASTADAGSSSAIWLGDAGELSSSSYALASTYSDLIFSVDGRSVLRFHHDGGAEVDGKPATRKQVCDGFEEWLKADGYGGAP